MGIQLPAGVPATVFGCEQWGIMSRAAGLHTGMPCVLPSLVGSKPLPSDKFEWIASAGIQQAARQAGWCLLFDFVARVGLSRYMAHLNRFVPPPASSPLVWVVWAVCGKQCKPLPATGCVALQGDVVSTFEPDLSSIFHKQF